MRSLYPLICAVLLVSLASPALAVDYQVVSLSGLPGTTSSTPESINSSGQLVMNTSLGSVILQNGAYTQLLPLPGYTYCWAFKINNSGQVVGYSADATGASEACMWQDGRVIDLGWSGDARGINDNGQIVGRGSNYTQAVLWQNGSFQYLGEGEAADINNLGQVVGSDLSGNAVLWQNGTTTILGTGYARDINDSGQIVGGSGNRACLWQNGTTQLFGLSGASAYSINNSGQVVGYRIGGIWQDGVVTPLPTLTGYTPYQQLFISNEGTALGSLMSTTNGKLMTVLWQPVPEPSGIIALSTLAGCLAGCRLKRSRKL